MVGQAIDGVALRPVSHHDQAGDRDGRQRGARTRRPRPGTPCVHPAGRRTAACGPGRGRRARHRRTAQRPRRSGSISNSPPMRWPSKSAARSETAIRTAMRRATTRRKSGAARSYRRARAAPEWNVRHHGRARLERRPQRRDGDVGSCDMNDVGSEGRERRAAPPGATTAAGRSARSSRCTGCRQAARPGAPTARTGGSRVGASTTTSCPRSSKRSASSRTWTWTPPGSPRRRDMRARCASVRVFRPARLEHVPVGRRHRDQALERLGDRPRDRRRVGATVAGAFRHVERPHDIDRHPVGVWNVPTTATGRRSRARASRGRPATAAAPEHLDLDPPAGQITVGKQPDQLVVGERGRERSADAVVGLERRRPRSRTARAASRRTGRDARDEDARRRRPSAGPDRPSPARSRPSSPGAEARRSSPAPPPPSGTGARRRPT